MLLSIVFHVNFVATKTYCYNDKRVSLFRQKCADISTKKSRYSDRSVPIFRQNHIDIPTKVCQYFDKKVPIFRQKCADIPTKVCRYSDKFSSICRNNGPYFNSENLLFRQCWNIGTNSTKLMIEWHTHSFEVTRCQRFYGQKNHPNRKT